MNVDTRPRRIASILVLLAACTTLSTCVRRQPSDGQPGQPRETRFVYKQSKGAASGLRVVQILNATAEEKTDTTTNDGRVLLYPDAEVTVSDPGADGCVLLTFRTDARPAATMAVAEAIRVRGRIPPEQLTDLRLQYGWGRRIPAGRRFRMLHDRALAIDASENRPLGLELPFSPESWRVGAVDAAGAFTTGWFPAEEAPQIVAWNNAGQVAVEDVPLRGVTPRATLDAPAPRFVQTKRLDLTFSAPANAAAAIAAQIYLRGAHWRAEDRALVARYLSVLDRIDTRTFAFATMVRPFTFAPGETTIAFLPPWSSVDVRVMDAIVSNAADLALPLPETSTRLDVKGEHLLPAGGQTLPLQGTVVLERVYVPIADATVVYSCYPDKFETTTDRFGNFVIPRACVGRESTVFVTTKDERFAPSQATQTLTHRPGPVGRLVIELPERKVPYAAAPNRPPRFPPAEAIAAARELASEPRLRPFPTSPFWTGGQPVPPDAVYFEVGDDDDGTPILGTLTQEMPQRRVPVTSALWISKERMQVRIVVAESDRLDVFLTLSPCWVAASLNVDFEAGVPKDVALTPVGDTRFLTSIWANRYTPPNNPVVPGTAISFINPLIEPDSVEIDTGLFGISSLQSCNLPYAYVFVADANMGCFENVVDVDNIGNGYITLHQCTTTASDSPPRPIVRR